MTDKPDYIVARRIVIALREKKLLTEDRLKGLEEKLASGAVSTEDWRILAELGGESPKKEQNNGGEN